MQKRTLRLALFMAVLACALPASAQSSAISASVDATHLSPGVLDLGSGWRTHSGDNLAWAQPSFDDSAWDTADLDDLGAAQPGWRWYRLRLRLGAGHTHEHLLLEGGQDTYELYIDGEQVTGTAIHPLFGATRPTEQIYPLPDQAASVVLALRTYAGRIYTSWHLPLFLSASVGTPDAIAALQAELQSQRLYAALPSIAINLLLLMAGLGALALWHSQRRYREYLWLGLYLFLLGASNLLQGCASEGVICLSWNNLLSDPLIYVFTMMQIEFTFSFAGQRVGRIWRTYEALLMATLIFGLATLFGTFPSSVYLLVEAAVILPAALVLPVLLFVWYRRGNREAGWLILPSLFPAASAAILDLGSASIYSGWGRADFLANPIPLGPVPLQTADLGDLLFLLAIAIVMFFRFTRVSREQARAAAELEAAQKVQSLLVHSTGDPVSGWKIDAVYLPAGEVGGDFYHLQPLSDGAALVIVGDVSGKGVEAALRVAAIIGALRETTARTPSVVLHRLNSILRALSDGGFTTCLCARISADGSVIFASAGHLAPYRNGEEIPLPPGLPLGITPEADYREVPLTLHSGDTLTFLSDGVVEARNANSELFGFDRACSISMQSADDIARAAQAFGQQDDITVLTLTFAPAEVAHA